MGLGFSEFSLRFSVMEVSLRNDFNYWGILSCQRGFDITNDSNIVGDCLYVM